MTWSDLGSVSISASDLSVDLGPISLPAGHNRLYLRVTQLMPQENWRYSFGIASFVSTEGAELGAVKVYGNTDGQVFTLGEGRTPLVGDGVLRFRPRHYNLRWVALTESPNWDLAFEWDSEEFGSASAGAGGGAVSSSLGDLDNTRVSYAIGDDGLARIKLTEVS